MKVQIMGASTRVKISHKECIIPYTSIVNNNSQILNLQTFVTISFYIPRISHKQTKATTNSEDLIAWSRQ